jgi:crotonobetaine/carnitine-CoA ligase
MYDGIKTIGAILEYRAATQPDREVLRFPDAAFSYRQLDEQASRVANALAALGLGKGDRVAVQLPNCPEFAAIWFGLGRAGMIEVPLNVGLRADLLAYTLNQAECKAVVILGEWAPRIDAIRGALTCDPHVIVVGERSAEVTGPATPFADLLTADAARPSTVVSPDDTSVLLFTSGTTGPSKGVVLTHNANFFLAETNVLTMEYGESERLFTAFPLFHVNAKYTTVLPTFLMDAGSSVVHDKFSASRFWDICRDEAITGINFMGALILMLYKQPERPDDRDNPVRTGYGAPAPPDITPAFEERFGVTLCEGYGSTELGLAIANRPSHRKIGTAGHPVPGLEVQIQDERGDAVPRGTVGEIVVRPQAPHLIVEEYWGMAEATKDAFRNLWFHTGDRGRQDDDGWFVYVDRAKDAIRRRGENISSWEVERCLSSHPGVLEVAVIGVPSELTEEEVLAVVVPRAGEAVAPEELLDFAQERLPHFAVPRYVSFADDLPRNPQQRVQKFVLREAGLPADAWDRESVGYVVAR